MDVIIKRAETAAQIDRCLLVLLQLRAAYAGKEADMLKQILVQQEREGFELHYVEGNGQVVACAGIRFLTLLAYSGKVMYVDDLVTSNTCRSKGYAGQLVDYLSVYAKQQGCVSMTLDSGVQRFAAHRFYLREHFDIVSHHFVRQLVD